MPVIYSIIIPVLMGILFSLRLNYPLYLTASLAYPLGIGILGILMFILVILRIPLDLVNVSIPAWIIIALLLFFVVKSKKSITLKMPSLKLFSIIDWILIFLISLKIVYVFFEALIKPVSTWDAWGRYALVAKAIFIDKTFLTEFAIQRMEDYPPLIPLNQAWILISQGYWNDIWIQIISPMLFFSLLVIFYYGIRKSLKKTPALFFTFLLSTLPFVVYHSTTAYLDLPLTFYYSSAAIFLYLFMKDKDEKDLILSAILLGLAIWIKRGGIYLTLIDTTVFIIFLIRESQKSKRSFSWLPIIKYLSIILSVSLPWFIYNKIAASVHHYTAANLIYGIDFELLDRFPAVFEIFANKMFHSANWHLSWALCLAALIFFFKKLPKAGLLYLLAIIILNLFALVYIFIFTGSFQYLLDGTLLNRIMMYMMPVVLFFSGLLIFEETD